MKLAHDTLPKPCPSLFHAVGDALQIQGKPWNLLAGGRVNTVWRVGDVAVKHYNKDGESPLFPNDLTAEACALSLLAPLGLAPTLLTRGKDWLAYRYISGHSWQTGAHAVGMVLHRLHTVTPPTASFRKTPVNSTELLAKAKAIATLCTGLLPAPPIDPKIPATQNCLIHTDPVPGNIIDTAGKLMLIDWQCPAVGDPTEDIAMFLSPAMQWLYRGAELTKAETQAFLSAFPAQTVARYTLLAPLYHWRMAAHCLWKAEHDAKGYALAMKRELTALEKATKKNARKGHNRPHQSP